MARARGLTTTLLLVVVLGGLVAYIYFVDARREETDPNARPRAYDQLATDAIEELQFKAPGGETARVRLADGNWQIVEPVTTDADDGVVGTVTSNLGTLEVQRVVDENPSDLAQYGLNPARIEVGFRLRDQQEFRRLLVGEKTPTGGDLYAKRADENQVFLISAYLDAIFTKTPFDLRDKAILKFERDKADGVEISRAAGTLGFARTGTDWRIVEPVTARADYAATEGLMTRLASTHMLTVASETGDDLRKYGLDRPSMTASVTTGSSKATLLLGSMSEDGGYYAKDAARPAIFTVEQALATDLGKDVAEFRRKDLFDARSFNTNRLEVTRGGQTLALEKRDQDGKTIWRTASNMDVDAAKVEEALGRLSTLRVETFQSAAPPSLRMPVASVTIRFDENRTETVTFGRSGNEIHASRADEPGAGRVDTAAFDEAIKALDGLP